MSVQILGADGVSVLSVVNLGASKYGNYSVPVQSDGQEIYPVFAGEYYISFAQRFNAAFPIASSMFALRNGSSKTMKVLEIQVGAGFDGTAEASTMQIVGQKIKSSSATPTGGNQLGSIIGWPGNPSFAIVDEAVGQAASTVADARFALATTPLTTTGIVTSSPVFNLMLPRSTTGNTISVNWSRDLEIAPNEGIIVSQTFASVIGDSLSFTMYWGEF